MRQKSYAITMRQPATRWQDGLPCGNGTIGALVYGHVKHELILVNHEHLWLRTPKPTLPDVSGHLPELRRRLAEGCFDEAAGLLMEKLREQGYGREHVDPYHPAFDIAIEADTALPPMDYRRSLTLETGVAVVAWREGETAFERAAFVSCADNVIVVRVASRGPKPVGVLVKLQKHAVAPADDNWFTRQQSAETLPIAFDAGVEALHPFVTGAYTGGGQFGGLARVIAVEGKVEQAEGGVRVSGAREALVLVKVFANEPSREALSRLRRELTSLNTDYNVLLARHARAHGELFGRLALTLSSKERRSNEELLLAAAGGEVSASLVERMFAFGRYLLMCSSRPGGWPANLQGIWNGNYAPAWWSDFHNDENIQMNYWQALPGNMPEAALPFFDFYEASLEDWRENALKIYGCRGVLAGISQSTHGFVFPGKWVNWTAGAGWLAQLFYDYWLFTGDREFLARRAVPFMKEVALFYEDFLFVGEDGRLVFAPSLSPENSPAVERRSIVTVNAAMDVAVAKEVLSNLCAACEALGIEEKGVAKWRERLTKLPVYMINEDGALKEWLHPDLRDNYHHRHLSHLYPVFPGYEINIEDRPDLFAAARTAVEKRLVVGLDSQTGWSFAHMACIYARLGDGNRALECLELIVRACTGPNLFTYHNDWRGQGMSWFWGHGVLIPFQIDANLGLTAAVQEMLVQSRPGFIAILPALPAKWPTGRVDRLQTRCGVEVSLRWDACECRVRLKSRAAQVLTVRLPDPIDIEAGRHLSIQRHWTMDERHYAKIELPAGKTALFVAGRTAHGLPREAHQREGAT